MTKLICMIPARLGSRRVKEKSLRRVGGHSLLGRAVMTALQVPAYDEVWVNTPDERLVAEAERYGARIHRRPPGLDGPNTNNKFKHEFCTAHAGAEWIVAQNPTSPLLSPQTVQRFCERLLEGDLDTLHSVRREQAYYFDHLDRPVNFDLAEALDTQDLPPVWRVVWALTGWRRTTFLAHPCGVWAGKLGFFEMAGDDAVDVDTEQELGYAQWCAKSRTT